MRVREREVPFFFLYVDFHKKVVVLSKITAAKMPFSRPAEVTLTVLRVLCMSMFGVRLFILFSFVNISSIVD